MRSLGVKRASKPWIKRALPTCFIISTWITIMSVPKIRGLVKEEKIKGNGHFWVRFSCIHFSFEQVCSLQSTLPFQWSTIDLEENTKEHGASFNICQICNYLLSNHYVSNTWNRIRDLGNLRVLQKKSGECILRQKYPSVCALASICSPPSCSGLYLIATVQRHWYSATLQVSSFVMRFLPLAFLPNCLSAHTRPVSLHLQEHVCLSCPLS